MSFKPIGEAAAKAIKHRKFTWCRRPNGFSDFPIWRVVAMKCNMPLYQVLAFVNRLEELGNDAANSGLTRGSLERFDADEFAVALGMVPDEVARLYAALEDPKIGWISFDQIASFYDRNPDRDEDAGEVAQRKRRERARKKCRELLARLARAGLVAEHDRVLIEVSLRGISDADLVLVQNRLARAELSTGRDRHVVTARDIVTVTSDQTTILDKTTEVVVDNSGDGIRGETAGLPMGAGGEASAELAAATAWIDSEGVQKLVDYLTIRTTLAETYVERWRRDVQDDEALAAIIKGADGAGYIGARFHTIVTDQIRRFLAQRANGPSLPLMPPRPSSALRKAEPDECHNVTSPPGDNRKRNAS